MRRVEAIHAMQAFGVHGYGPEAAATIFQILREHCREFPDWGNYKVYNVFKDAFRKIGQPSVAVLLPGLNEPALRELCLRTLVRSVGEPADVQVPALEPADVRVLVKITLGNSQRHPPTLSRFWEKISRPTRMLTCERLSLKK